MNRSSTKVTTQIVNKSISTFLTSPTKVAETLNWKKNAGSIVSLFITKNRIDIALSSHPELDEKILQVQPIALSNHVEGCRKVIDDSVGYELIKIVQNYNVCGIIVGWPVEKEGWCGASCGRVLHTLDGIANISSSGTIFLSQSRPICLYDMNHYVPKEDEWGRSTIYCETTNDLEHIHHEKHSDEWVHSKTMKTNPAVTLLQDFCKTYWPDNYYYYYYHKTMYREEHCNRMDNSTTPVVNDDEDDDDMNSLNSSHHNNNYYSTTTSITNNNNSNNVDSNNIDNNNNTNYTAA